MKTRTLLLSGLAVLIILLVLGRFYFSEEDFNLQNPDWNGLSHLASAIHATPLYSTATLAGQGSGKTLLIVGPKKNYTTEESSQVLSFLHSGGKVVVADDLGSADSLLDAIGSPITIDPVLMCQYENYYVNQTFPIITNISSPNMQNVRQIVLNHPASLNVTDTAEIIASTSDKAWLDYNGNLSLDGDERMGIYPVAAIDSFAGGQLLVISDPDVFVNSMQDKGDNAVFASDIFTGPVMVDVSHGMDVTPVGSVYYLIKLNQWAQVLAAVLIVCALLAFMARTEISAFLGSKRRKR
jgi:hypothetical protein